MSQLFKRRNVEYVNEIQSYNSLPRSEEEIDPLQWWKNNETQYPNLAQMACDYLAIPASSVPSEQCFSLGKNLITDNRNKLAEKTVRAYMCLKS